MPRISQRLKGRVVAAPPLLRRGSTTVSWLLLLLGFGVALGQESQLEGRVTDTSGAVIPGAEVKLTNLETNVVRVAVTGDNGFYILPLLKEGTYRVEASLAGFRTATTTIKLDFGQVLRQDFQLSVGEIREVVEVKSTAARIQQQPHSVGTVIEAKQISELPLDGRNYLSLANLAPGILRGNQGNRGEQTGPEGGFRSGGLAMDQTAILVDGVDNASRIVQGPLITQAQTLKPAVEAISEFKVVTNNISAEYGYKAGAQVLVSTKGGTNEFHGTLYEFHRNNATAANNFMFNRDGPRDPETNELSSERPPFIRNQFGGTLGGPIIRDKTFFFVSFQATRLRESGDSFLQSVPSPLTRNGDFSQELQIGNDGPNIFDPLTLTGSGPNAERQPFPNHLIPRERMDPAAVKLMGLFPMPNVPGREFQQFNFFHIQRNRNDNEVFDVRIDHDFSTRHRIYGRYSYRNEDSVQGGFLPFPARASNILIYRGHQAAINSNWTLGPRYHNELRGGFTHFPAARDDEHTENLNEKFGIPGATASQFPELVGKQFLQGVSFAFFGPRLSAVGGGSGGGTNTTTLDTFYLADNFIAELGKHSLKFGGEYRRWRSDRTQGNIFGTFNFDGRYTAQFPNVGASRARTGNTFADALLGMAFQETNGLPVGEDIASPYWGFYIQDNWRITPRLTLNLGLRWELFGQPRHVNFDPTTPVAKPIFSGNLADETSPVLNVRFERWEFPGDNDCGCRLDKRNWAPRIGIAYRLFENTVIRAGGGLYYSENGTAQLESNRFLVGGPNQVVNQVQGTFETPATTVSRGFTPLDLNPGDPTILNSLAVTVVPDFLPTISSAQWFFDIQHQLPWNVLLTFGYNGQAQSHLPWWNRRISAPLEPSEVNSFARLRVPPPAQLNSSRPVLFMLLNENSLSGSYNAFTFKAEKRFSQGLSFLSSFTWSKSLDYGVSSLNERGEGITAGRGGQPPSQYYKDLHLNRGPSGLSRDFAYNASFLYELPAGPGKGRFESGPASWLLGGWQLGAILSLQSGAWLSHVVTPDLQQTQGSYRGNLVGEVNLPESKRDSLRWFNDDAIVPGPPGEFGNAGRGLIEAPGWKNIDLLLSKNFPMPIEGHKLQFRFEAFNLTNTPHLGPPSLNENLTLIIIGNPNATRIITADEPRILQFALKYIF